MRNPTPALLLDMVCDLQPELDRDSAARLLCLDDALYEALENSWRASAALADQLLMLHIALDELRAA